jgi:hypothetical protein
MPSYVMGFTNTVSSANWDGVSNLLGEETGIATSDNLSAQFTIRVDTTNTGMIPSDATITGLEIRYDARRGGGSSVALTVQARLGAAVGNSEVNALTPNYTGFTIGDPNNLLGLSVTPSNYHNLTARWTVSALNGGGASAQIQKFSATGVPNYTIHYTLPYSNKIYNTSGKLSITSGKVSLT